MSNGAYASDVDDTSARASVLVGGHTQLRAPDQYRITYTPGFKFKHTADITTHTIVNLCIALENEFGDGYLFVPEAITEGGIEVADWPGRRSDEEYKTFRFSQQEGEFGCWPSFTETPTATLTAWWTDDARVIFPLDREKKNSARGSLLKSFYGAPVWTVAELRKVAAAFEAVGLDCVRSTIPGARKLSEEGSQYT